MALACPKCENTQVTDVPGYYKELAPGAELKAELAPPPSPALELLPAAGGAIVGVLLLVDGAVLFGVLALAAAGVVGFKAYGSFVSARDEMSAWQERMCCRVCHHRFPRSAGLIAKAA